MNRFTVVNRPSSYSSPGDPLCSHDLRFDLARVEFLAMLEVAAIVLKANYFQLALTVVHPMIIARSYRSEALRGAELRRRRRENWRPSGSVGHLGQKEPVKSRNKGLQFKAEPT